MRAGTSAHPFWKRTRLRRVPDSQSRLPLNRVERAARASTKPAFRRVLVASFPSDSAHLSQRAAHLRAKARTAPEEVEGATIAPSRRRRRVRTTDHANDSADHPTNRPRSLKTVNALIGKHLTSGHVPECATMCHRSRGEAHGTWRARRGAYDRTGTGESDR